MTSVVHHRKDGENQKLDEKGRQKHSAVNWPVFTGSVIIMVAFVAWAAIWPEAAEATIFGSMDWIATNFGWYYVLTASIVVVFVIVVALSRVGNTKLGPDHSKPKFRLFTWAAMLFAAGIGVDLMFFGVSGPATNLLTPPEGTSMSDEAARMAPLWTIFHYGIPGWAMYALMGLAFGLFAYRYHLPLSIRSALAPIFGKRINGPIGHAAEIGATIGTIFGISVSLGIGVVFLNFGLSIIFDIPVTIGVQIALMAISVLIAIISTVSGVEKGIRRLSEFNVILAVILMVWVVAFADTNKMLNAIVQNIGDFFSRFPSMMMNTFAYTEGTPDYPADQWMADWTLFFWAWWIAWAPFVSLFLARISRGRTVREFVVGVLLIPFTFILLWISVFGNGAISFFRGGDEQFLDEAINLPESGFYTLIQQYPGSTFTVALAVLTGLFFYVTSADSGSLVMANMTSKPSVQNSDGPPWLRIVWAITTGALTLSMLFIDGVYTLQAATVMVGLPLSILTYLVMFSLWKVLHSERLTMESAQSSMHSIISSRVRSGNDTRPWQERLKHRMGWATHQDTVEFIENVTVPAVEEVAAEFEALGSDVECSRGIDPEHGIPYVDLVVRFQEQEDFKYQAYPVAYPIPQFATRIEEGQTTYFRTEIFSNTGSRGNDIYGLTSDQVIADILDAYDAHTALMTRTGSRGAPVDATTASVPSTWVEEDDSTTQETSN